MSEYSHTDNAIDLLKNNTNNVHNYCVHIIGMDVFRSFKWDEIETQQIHMERIIEEKEKEKEKKERAPQMRIIISKSICGSLVWGIKSDKIIHAFIWHLVTCTHCIQWWTTSTSTDDSAFLSLYLLTDPCVQHNALVAICTPSTVGCGA